jgi:hypothetical protein
MTLKQVAVGDAIKADYGFKDTYRMVRLMTNFLEGKSDKKCKHLSYFPQ